MKRVYVVRIVWKDGHSEQCGVWAPTEAAALEIAEARNPRAASYTIVTSLVRIIV
jgi:hypothetical protein